MPMFGHVIFAWMGIEQISRVDDFADNFENISDEKFDELLIAMQKSY
jgi:hypothetical protein